MIMKIGKANNMNVISDKLFNMGLGCILAE